MSATLESPSRKPLRASGRAVFGCLSFAVGGPLVAALVWPGVMLIAWSLIDGPSWDVLKTSASMVPLIFFASFLFGYFLPAMVTGGIMGALGTRIRRRWFVLLGVIVGAGTMVGYVLLQTWLIKADKVGDINAIATLDAIVTSAVICIAASPGLRPMPCVPEGRQSSPMKNAPAARYLNVRSMSNLCVVEGWSGSERFEQTGGQATAAGIHREMRAFPGILPGGRLKIGRCRCFRCPSTFFVGGRSRSRNCS